MSTPTEIQKNIDHYIGLSNQIANVTKKSLAVLDPAKYLAQYKEQLEAIKKRGNEHILSKWKESEAWGLSDEQRSALVSQEALSGYQAEINFLNANFPDIDAAFRQANIGSNALAHHW